MQADEDLVCPGATTKNTTSSVATCTSSGSGSHRPAQHKMSPGPIWLLRRQRSRRWTYDSSLCSLESCSTDPGTPSTVETSLDTSESPKTAADRRARRLRRMSRASSVSAATYDADSVGSLGDTVGGADSTLQLRFKSLVRRQGSSFRVAAGLLVSHCRRRSTGFSSSADSFGDISIGASSLRSVQTERKAVKVLGTMFMLFFISWASFFSMNLAMGLCPTCHFEELLYKWFLWLGYSSSILNPIIYTVFNRAFKQTFLRLLTCGLKRIPSQGQECKDKTETKTKTKRSG